jgi:hypothetical protein
MRDCRDWVVWVVKREAELLDAVKLVEHGHAKDASGFSKADETIAGWINGLPLSGGCWSVDGEVRCVFESHRHTGQRAWKR